MDQEDHHFVKSLEQQWTCSISKMLMKDPVVTADGHTYDRESITQWLLNDHKSPNTGLELSSINLIPNIAFKNLIEKLNQNLPQFLATEEGFKTCIQQLKEEIDYLKIELQHEKEKNDEHIEKQETDFKTKRIEKSRHEDKNIQLKIIRDQKNVFQKQLQQLQTKEQQQRREICLLKEELQNFKTLYTDASKAKREFEDLYNRVQENRQDFMDKLQDSFSSNLRFIGHLLQSIEDAKKFQTEVSQKEKGSLETIVVQGFGQIPQENPEIRGNNVHVSMNDEVIKRLEQIIRQRVNEMGRDQGERAQNYIMTEGRRVFLRRRRLSLQRRRNRERGHNIPNPTRQSLLSFLGQRRGIRGGANIFGHPTQGTLSIPSESTMRLLIRQNRNPNQLQQLQLQNQPQPQPQPQYQLQAQPQSQLQPQLQPQPQHQPQHQPQSQPQLQMQNIRNTIDTTGDSGLYRQLQSIKWLMSKRNYRHFSSFYDYAFIRSNNDEHVFWYGVRIKVLESRIPFVEYLNYFWNHVRILDLSACNVDDQLWQKFIECSNTNFLSLALINLDRNNITTIKKTDLEKFAGLRRFSVNRNKLSDDSKKELNDFITAHPTVKVEFRFNDGEEGSDVDF